MVPLPIVFVMPSFDPGGTERQMIQLIRRLDRSRWQVHVACFRQRGAWLSKVAEVAPIVEFPVRSFRHPNTLGQMRAFAGWCRTVGAVAVHTTDLPSNMFGLPAARLAGVPVRIGNRREVNPGRTIFEIAVQRIAYGCAHCIVANCRAAADQLRRENVPARKIGVIPNGVSIETSDESERRWTLRRVIVVANLRREKGHDVMLRAASQIIGRFPDASFEFVGGGPELPALRALSDQLGLSASVAFTGHREDVAARLAAADIFVLPSRSEAFPNAVLEAMAARVPVVASGVGGVLEVVRDGETGIIVPPGDPAALAAGVCRLMADPALASSIARSAQSDVTNTYSFDRMIGEFEALYLKELARGGRLPLARLGLAVS